MTSPALSFRAATDADFSRLLALRKQTMDPHLTASGLSTDEDAHLRRLNYHWEDARLILRGDEEVGLLKAYREEAGWYVVQIQIAPAYQRQGLGRQALETVLLQADAENVSVSLSVLKVNPAKHLYDRLGFLVASQTENDFLMTRPAQGFLPT